MVNRICCWCLVATSKPHASHGEAGTKEWKVEGRECLIEIGQKYFHKLLMSPGGCVRSVTGPPALTFHTVGTWQSPFCIRHGFVTYRKCKPHWTAFVQQSSALSFIYTLCFLHFHHESHWTEQITEIDQFNSYQTNPTYQNFSNYDLQLYYPLYSFLKL